MSEDLPMVIEDCVVPALEVARRRVHQARLDVAGLSGQMPPVDVLTRAAAVAELQAAEAELSRLEAREALSGFARLEDEDGLGIIGNPGGES